MKTILFILLFLSSKFANSQITGTQHAYGGSSSDYFQSFKQTPDGGLIMVGSTSSYGTMLFPNDQDIYLIKTDASDHIAWSRTFADLVHIDEAIDVLTDNADSSYLLLTNFRDASYNNLFFGLCKLDKTGNALWNKSYSLNGLVAFAASIKELSDGFLISGAVYIDEQNDYDAFLLKVDRAGNEQWCKTYNTQSPYTDKAFSINFTNDGGFLLTGVSYDFLVHDYAMLAIKTDATGNLEWMKTYANSLNSRCVGGFQLSNGNYILGGQAVNFGPGANDFLLMQTDITGNPVWTKVYGDSFIQLASDIIETDKGPLLVGTSNSSSLPKVAILKTDFNGSIISSYVYGDSAFSQSGKKCLLIDSNKLLIGGERVGSFNFGYSAEDFLLIKTDSNYSSGCLESAFTPDVISIIAPFSSFTGYDSLTVSNQDITFDTDSGAVDTIFCETITSVPSSPLKEELFNVFPNPASDELTLLFSKSISTDITITIFNSLGEKIINSVYHPSHTNELHLSLHIKAGIYFLNVYAKDGTYYSRKILIEK